MAGNIRKKLRSVKEKTWLVGINVKAVGIFAIPQHKRANRKLCFGF